jgi:hypothetical protein
MASEPVQPENDEDLVAYLDGELVGDAATQVDEKLARNPRLRQQAEQYRKTFDLLDHLPLPEPSPNFASRTLTQLQPNLSKQQADTGRSRVWPKYLLLAGLMMLAFTLGAAIPLATATPDNRKNDDSLDDTPVVEALPMYFAVDNLEFIKSLHSSSTFPDVTSNQPELVRYNSQELDQLVIAFRQLDWNRQQQLRQLHADLQALPTAERIDLQQTMEQYSAWVERLPEQARKRVLEATPDKRLEAVTDTLAKQHQDRLPEQKKSGLKQLAVTERLEFLQAYDDTQRSRQQEWQLAQRQWRDMKEMGDAPPWPFNDEKLTKEIDEYIRTVLGADPTKLMQSLDKKTDLPAECRLTREEILDLRRRREDAFKSQYWLTYGQLLLRLSRDHASLPRAKTGDVVVRPVQIKNLPVREAALAKFSVGKWPEFALDVVRRNRLDPKQTETLGPARPEDFSDAISEAMSKQLLPKLTTEEKKKLDGLLGRWPAYPEEVMKLAAFKNVSLPEVCLPGEPEKWKKYYELPGAR